MHRFLPISMFIVLATNTAVFGQAGQSAAEFKRFQGSWRVTELIDDGQVISPEAIKTTLPSGGQAEIVSNTIQFTSPTAGNKTAKVLSLDPTVYPKSITVSTLENLEGWGIYRFEGERLIICISDPAVAPRPSDFSSRPGTKHMRMVLERTDTVQNASPKSQLASAPETTKLKLPPPPAQAPPPTGVTALVLTDAEVTKMLHGSWRLNDGGGVLQINFDPSGSYRSYREVANQNTFYKAFVHGPVAIGTWGIQNGNLYFRATFSADRIRENHTYYLAVRSITAQDFIFADSVGRVGKAVRLR